MLIINIKQLFAILLNKGAEMHYLGWALPLHIEIHLDNNVKTMYVITQCKLGFLCCVHCIAFTVTRLLLKYMVNLHSVGHCVPYGKLRLHLLITQVAFKYSNTFWRGDQGVFSYKLYPLVSPSKWHLAVETRISISTTSLSFRKTHFRKMAISSKHVLRKSNDVAEILALASIARCHLEEETQGYIL